MRMHVRFEYVLALSVLMLAATSSSALAAPAAATKWVPTWVQSMTSNNKQVKRAGGSLKKDGYDHPVDKAPGVHDVTLRQTVLSSIGGNRVRIRLSNYYGLKPLHVTRAHIARHTGDKNNLSVVDTSSDHGLTFNGKHSVTIAPGHQVVSDPVTMHVPSLSLMTVSLYFAHTARLADMHMVEEQTHTTYIAPGNLTRSASLHGNFKSTVLNKKWPTPIYILTGVEVSVPKSTRCIVAFGDSITDGFRATTLAGPWPTVLSSIANGPRGGTPAAVANAAIGGDELTTDQIGNTVYGASGLKRFERDVIDQPGITDVIVLFGTNDINRGIDPAGYPNGVSVGDLIAGYRMLIDVAHQHHLRIYAGTVTPFAGVPSPRWSSPQKEAVREKVNHWIRTSRAFDGIIDFAAAVEGHYKPSPVAAKQTPLPPGMATVCAYGPGLHPNDRGYAVMGVHAYNVLFNAHVKPHKTCH